MEISQLKKVMFWKKLQSQPSESDQPTQSQSVGGSVTGSTVQMGQAGNDLQQSQIADNQSAQQGITGVEVVKLLTQLEMAVKASTLTIEQQEELLDYLRPAKREAGKDKPNKELVGQNLKRMSETMKTLKDTTEAGKGLWKTGIDVFKAVAPWIGVAVSVFGV